MTTNSYFNNHENVEEQDLLEELTIEAIQIAGMDLNYILRDTVDEDYLYNEDPTNAFTTYHTIEMMLKSVDGFGADLDLITSFGLEISENATFEVSIQRFKSVTLLDKPREGDLVYIPMTKSLMEVKKVKKDDPFYQRGKVYVYELTLELFEYSQEEFNTGIVDVDSLIANFDTENNVNNDPIADNNEIDTEADSIRTFDENDPFGSY